MRLELSSYVWETDCYFRANTHQIIAALVKLLNSASYFVFHTSGQWVFHVAGQFTSLQLDLNVIGFNVMLHRNSDSSMS